MRKLTLLIPYLLVVFGAESQSSKTSFDSFTVNKPCPDIVLRNIRYYKKTKANLRDFRGQWLVLDFWNKYCGACIASFPHVSELQKHFQGRVQFMMVGIQDKEKQIEPMFARFREHEGLVMPCAFDSLLAQRFDIYSAPEIIIIDPEGIVRADTYKMDQRDIEDFLEGKPVKLYNDSYNASKISFDENRPFLIDGNGGVDSVFLFRSVLSLFDKFKQRGSSPETIAQDSAHGRVQILGLPLQALYWYAYLGKYDFDSDFLSNLILEIKDSSLFKYSSSRSENLFCYSLQVPPNRANAADMMEVMQRDLENYTGFKVSIEKRPLIIGWKLIASDDAKKRLKTKGGTSFQKEVIPRVEWVARNISVSDLTKFLHNKNDLYKIFDETGIEGNIDISLDCVLFNIHEVKKNLQAMGLDLVPVEEEKKAIVIRDKEAK